MSEHPPPHTTLKTALFELSSYSSEIVLIVLLACALGIGWTTLMVHRLTARVDQVHTEVFSQAGSGIASQLDRLVAHTNTLATHMARMEQRDQEYRRDIHMIQTAVGAVSSTQRELLALTRLGQLYIVHPAPGSRHHSE